MFHMVLTAVLSLLIGILLGYGIFYLRYENRDLVIELRNSIKNLNKELGEQTIDYEEHKQQNVILKEKVTELFDKNDDLVGVVSELSRYYYNIKVGAEKLQELAKYLQMPDSTIETRVEKYSSMFDEANKGQGSKDTFGASSDEPEFF